MYSAPQYRFQQIEWLKRLEKEKQNKFLSNSPNQGPGGAEQAARGEEGRQILGAEKVRREFGLTVIVLMLIKLLLLTMLTSQLLMMLIWIVCAGKTTWRPKSRETHGGWDSLISFQTSYQQRSSCWPWCWRWQCCWWWQWCCWWWQRCWWRQWCWWQQ